MYSFLLLGLGMFVVIGSILWLRLHAFLALLAAALIVAALTPSGLIEKYALDRGMTSSAARQLSQQTSGERVAQAFGQTCGQVGIVIAMASIIGVCLLESGAADRLVRSTIKLLGEPRAPLAFLGGSFVLAMPVFFDTVFYLMVPIAKAMSTRTGKDYLLYILAIVSGGVMAHSLVPPTPGPLFMAEELGVDIGVMILGGSAIGLFAAMVGYIYARWANRTWTVPLRESEDALRQLKELAGRRDSDLPSVWMALLPVVLPVLLISANTIVRSMNSAMQETTLGPVILFLGNKNIALSLAAAIALLAMFKVSSRIQAVTAARRALGTAGVIILIIGAGGAFGAALQQTDIRSAIEGLSSRYQLSVIPLAFLLTMLIRTAQGSATVAMITAAGVFGGVAAGGAMGFHPLYLALAIGCGSKPIWWMNDSGFWVVSQMSGMTEEESLKTLTPLSALMGVAGLLATMLGAAVLPLV